MIHVFHGFLGSPRDFEFLAAENVMLHDLYHPTPYKMKPDDILMGYSMGGRKALQLAMDNQFAFKKLVLISAHPGLTTDRERHKRKTWEDEILLMLQKMNSNDFLDAWNELPIFKDDEPLVEISSSRFEASSELFQEMRLSTQADFLPEILNHLDKVLWIVGNQDQKYMKLMKEKLLPNDVRVKCISGGHRLYQKPHALMEILREENIL